MGSVSRCNDLRLVISQSFVLERAKRHVDLDFLQATGAAIIPSIFLLKASCTDAVIHRELLLIISSTSLARNMSLSGLCRRMNVSLCLRSGDIRGSSPGVGPLKPWKRVLG